MAVFWVIVLMILFSFPTSGNISWPFMVGTVVSCSSTTSAGRGPGSRARRSMGAEAELTELEREFEQAAEQLGGTTTA